MTEGSGWRDGLDDGLRGVYEQMDEGTVRGIISEIDRDPGGMYLYRWRDCWRDLETDKAMAGGKDGRIDR